MKRTLLAVVVTVVVVLALEAAALVISVYSGAYSISTYNHDNAFINWALDTGMTRSVARRARGLQIPSLDQPMKIQEGFRHYQEMCVFCHGAPGVAPGEIAKGLWPHAPDLARTVPTWTAAELFWITKYGVKFTAMPAWGPTHTDDQIWAMVAFLETLPRLSPAEYQEMEQKAGHDR